VKNRTLIILFGIAVLVGLAYAVTRPTECERAALEICAGDSACIANVIVKCRGGG